MTWLGTLLNKNGMLVGNLVCLVLGIVMVVFLSSRLAGPAYILTGIVYFVYRLVGWKWLEKIYFPIAIIAIILAIFKIG